MNLLVQERQDLRSPRLVPPVAHEIHGDAKHAQQVHARILHSSVGVPGDFGAQGPAGLGVGPDLVSGFSKREREEFRTFRL